MGPALGSFTVDFFETTLWPWWGSTGRNEYSKLQGPNCQSRINDLLDLLGVDLVGLVFFQNENISPRSPRLGHNMVMRTGTSVFSWFDETGQGEYSKLQGPNCQSRINDLLDMSGVDLVRSVFLFFICLGMEAAER